MKRKGIIQAITSIIFFIASCYCLLWVLSSSSLAFQACDGAYSLFHQNIRCRQPYIATILSIVFGILSIFLMYSGIKNIRISNSEGKTVNK